jgi:hypothetical protein
VALERISLDDPIVDRPSEQPTATFPDVLTYGLRCISRFRITGARTRMRFRTPAFLTKYDAFGQFRPVRWLTGSRRTALLIVREEPESRHARRAEDHDGPSPSRAWTPEQMLVQHACRALEGRRLKPSLRGPISDYLRGPNSRRAAGGLTLGAMKIRSTGRNSASGNSLAHLSRTGRRSAQEGSQANGMFPVSDPTRSE